MQNTSTPQRPKDLRRRSLLNVSISSTPLVTNNTNSTSTTCLEPVDDEKERFQRRSTVAMQKRVSNITPTKVRSLLDVSVHMEENQMQDHLKICVKLYTENRISAKNAWQLHVIDAMRKIASSSNDNVLQIAGPSLDIGAKIYGLRVDDIHAKGLQLASSISKSDQVKEGEEGDEETNLETEVNEKRKRNTRKKTKKMASDKRNTIDRQEKSLFCPHKHTECDVFATKENIDTGAIDNLFTHKVPTSPGSHEFVLQSQKNYWSNVPDMFLEIEDKLVEVDLPQIDEYSVCAPFRQFEIGCWNPEEEEKFLSKTSTLPEPVLDENGLPIPELDGSIHNIFEDNDVLQTSDGEEEREGFHAQIHGAIAHIVDTLPEGSRIETEYGYNTLIRTTSGRYIEKIWAGPSHWKIKFNRRSSAKYSGAVQHVVKHSRKAKVQQKVDFSKLVEEDICATIEKYAVKRGPRKTTVEKITLPIPEFSFENFHKFTDELFIKPGVARPKLSSTQEDSEDYEVQVSTYENPDDSQYCPQNNNNDTFECEPMGHTVEEASQTVCQEQFLNENLVNAPETVPNNQIPYAMQAKKMDMKKLKDATWKYVTQISRNIMGKVKFEPVQFSNLYHTLQQNVTPDMKKELTTPLALVALLHLCNEKNLELRQGDNYQDFTILRPQTE